MAKFEFGLHEAWLRLIIKKLPDHPDLFLPKAIEKAQTLLRIGNLKVNAARAWAESARIICKQKRNFILTPLGKIIARHDPDLEESGVWWAIHYNLASLNSPAWFYSFYFNEFKPDIFSREALEQEIRASWDKNHEKPMADSVFQKLTFSPLKQIFEETPFGEEFGFWIKNKEGNYIRKVQESPLFPRAIFAYALLDWAKKQQRQSVHMEKLLESGGVGKIFRLKRETLDTLLVDVGEQYEKKVAWISHTAGLNSVAIMDVPPLALVSAYYYELDGEDPMRALSLGQEELEEIINN